jgi:hypothetical protein
MGSPSLAAQLIEHDLVDEYRLMIEPILLGGGKRMFPDGGRARPLELGLDLDSRDRHPDLHLPAGGPLTLFWPDSRVTCGWTGVAPGDIPDATGSPVDWLPCCCRHPCRPQARRRPRSGLDTL